jgi:hypothetical protein
MRCEGELKRAPAVRPGVVIGASGASLIPNSAGLVSASRFGLGEEDRAYLVQIVAARTGLSPADADRRVTEVMESARAATRKALGMAAITGFMTATGHRRRRGCLGPGFFGCAGGRRGDGATGGNPGAFRDVLAPAWVTPRGLTSS